MRATFRSPREGKRKEDHGGEQDNRNDHHRQDDVPHVSPLRPLERTEGEVERGGSGSDDDRAEDHDRDQRVLELSLIHADTVTMKSHSGNVPHPIEAAIFDFDETMIDLEPQHTAASEKLCAAMGADYYELPESFRHASGKRVIDDVRELRKTFGWTAPMEELLALRLRYFDEACATGDLQLMDGVEDAARMLHSRGITLAVTSSAVGSSIDATLRRFALRDLFALIVDGGDVVRGKPDPEAYLLTAERLRVHPDLCIVFEDSTVGVRAAKNAGMFCVAVRNPNAMMNQDLSAADVIARSFAELDLEALVSPSRR